MSSPVYSKGTDMERAPRKWWAVEALDLDRRTVSYGCVLQFCCSFEDIEHYFGKTYKTIYLFWFMPWKMN